jgi:CRISPR-associated protein Cmr1
MNLDFECQIVTPMFMGGADPLKAELRASAVKGALRFWWRALNGALSLDELREKEGQLFGSTDAKQGQSKIRINLGVNQLHISKDPLPEHTIRVSSKGRMIPVNILGYLSYGTYKRNEIIKEYIKPGPFRLRIRTTGSSVEQENELINAIYLLTNFGGLGACSRNGYGSIYIDQEFFWSDPKPFLESLQLPESKPEYSALSAGLKLYRTKGCYETWDKALAELGKAYRSCRSSLEPKHSYDKRKFLCSPLIADRTTHSVIPRRAKPYFMHIAKVGNQFEGRMLYLPATFCTGLEKPTVDYAQLDANFSKVCAEMNELLRQSLEVVI